MTAPQKIPILFMLNLQLRDEFKSERLRGTTIDFSTDRPTSALQKSSAEFLSITYPSIDLLRVFEATQPGQSRPVVLLGGRGQGKSHLMAALWIEQLKLFDLEA
jgi:DNA replication protein DnaC